MRAAPRIGALLGALLVASAAAAATDYQRLLRIIAEDDAYKVRMKAIRLVVKRVKKSKQPAPGAVIDAIGRAAQRDDSYLVRGMACVALGQLADERGRGALEVARGDDEAFVKEQAKEALKRLRPAPPAPPPAAASGRIVLEVAPSPGVEIAAEISEALRSFTQDELRNQGPGYQLVTGGRDPGHLLTATVAKLASSPQAGGKIRLTAQVNIALATWPERNLRKILTAKAGASLKPSQDSLRFRKKLVRAAVRRAVADALAEIGGS